MGKSPSAEPSFSSSCMFPPALQNHLLQENASSALHRASSWSLPAKAKGLFTQRWEFFHQCQPVSSVSLITTHQLCKSFIHPLMLRCFFSAYSPASPSSSSVTFSLPSPAANSSSSAASSPLSSAAFFFLLPLLLLIYSR